VVQPSVGLHPPTSSSYLLVYFNLLHSSSPVHTATNPNSAEDRRSVRNPLDHPSQNQVKAQSQLLYNTKHLQLLALRQNQPTMHIATSSHALSQLVTLATYGAHSSLSSLHHIVHIAKTSRLLTSLSYLFIHLQKRPKHGQTHGTTSHNPLHKP
jgi:hypothetical protein